MLLRVSGLKMFIEDDDSRLIDILLKKIRVKRADLLGYKIFKKSVDARKSGQIYFIYTVDIELKDEVSFLKKTRDKDISAAPDLDYKYVRPGPARMKHRPIIVGSGPAGLFAAIILSGMGYKPLLLERGADVEARARAVQKFWHKGQLDPECNVQFGEGGAGTFSDGKLTTLIRDLRC
ncbi:MAG: FAD-dependent monooxygenase, partial [Syntrophomonadaceae bacterium]|nr:FAD-dependent monooxygenase [Syntrophomonadaceae bacterium]